MRNRFTLILCALALIVAGCRKDSKPENETPRQHELPELNDAAYLLDGLMKDVSGNLKPIIGSISSSQLLIPCESVFEAERHFLSLISPNGVTSERGDEIRWSLTDEKGAPQGDAVFSIGGVLEYASVTLPSAFPGPFNTIIYKKSFAAPVSVRPDVREDLEDNYYYGAIVNISDHGCGSGKFVVLREFDFTTGAAGMAIRLDGRRWHSSEMSQGSTEHDIASRASCLATMRTAGAIIRSDWNIITKQLLNAGSRMPDQHFYSADRQWTGLHYYYCLHDDECDTIGPFNDLDFYECWIYWFVPDGSSIRFW